MQTNGDIHHHKFDESNEELAFSIASGFAQRDAENAKNQYHAYCAIVGFSGYTQSNVIEIKKGKKETPKSLLSSQMLNLPTMILK
ncbi:hypothetical protein ABFY41_00870 [Acinetobacter haemolyticus]|uniref:hypothetical protein n=1 Tax=Acinetobacter haemolyticus TaxID=29430 RepID=UPI003D210485